MTLWRTNAGINKAEGTGATHGHKSVHRCVAASLSKDGGQLFVFRGCIYQETLCNRMSTAFT